MEIFGETIDRELNDLAKEGVQELRKVLLVELASSPLAAARRAASTISGAAGARGASGRT